MKVLSTQTIFKFQYILSVINGNHIIIKLLQYIIVDKKLDLAFRTNLMLSFYTMYVQSTHILFKPTLRFEC